MFEKQSDTPDKTKEDLGVFRPTKGSSKVNIGEGVTLKGEINNADEIQVDGSVDAVMSTDNLIVGGNGSLKGTINSHNADIWGKVEGVLNISGTLTIQEQGSVSGTIEYQNLQIKLGGRISGDIKMSNKVQKISDSTKKDNTTIQDSADNKEKSTA